MAAGEDWLPATPFSACPDDRISRQLASAVRVGENPLVEEKSRRKESKKRVEEKT